MNSHFKTVIAAATLLLATIVAPVAYAEGAVQAKEEKKVKPYTPTTCIVSGDKLGEMGKPVVFEYKGQEVKLCCKDCRKDFDKDPAKYLKKLEEKKQK